MSRWTDISQAQVDDFIRDRMVADKRASLPGSTIFAEYQRYAAENDHYPLNQHVFGRQFSKRAVKGHTSERVIYLGYRLTALHRED